MNPNDCTTSLDRRDDYAAAQYRKGLAHAQAGAVIHIAANGTWSAELPTAVTFEADGRVRREHRSISGYEILGLHRNTADLVRGWLDGGALVIDHRAAPAGQAD